MKTVAIAALMATALAGCAHAREEAPPKLTAKQAERLDKALKGKVAGKPEACVSMIPGGSRLETISDDVLIYTVNRNLVYRNDLSGTCNGISRGDTLVLKPTGSQYCRGDIAHVADLSIGMRSGSCALGDFVPYRTPGK